MLDINGTIEILTIDAYRSLGVLLKEISIQEDVPVDITIEGESLMETFQEFMETLRHEV